MIRPYGPGTLAGIGKALYTRGIGFAGGIRALAVRAPDEVGLIDELGELTWAEMDQRAPRLAPPGQPPVGAALHGTRARR